MVQLTPVHDARQFLSRWRWQFDKPVSSGSDFSQFLAQARAVGEMQGLQLLKSRQQLAGSGNFSGFDLFQPGDDLALALDMTFTLCDVLLGLHEVVHHRGTFDALRRGRQSMV
jgi:hypothetical protein